jgi:hypothetical protein
MKLKTEYINPPIPDRSNDWVAWNEDDPEFGCGHGRSEEEAIEDFKNLLCGDQNSPMHESFFEKAKHLVSHLFLSWLV